MRTTLDLDEDVLLAAKEMAARTKQTAGKVISDMFRRALQPAPLRIQPQVGIRVQNVQLSRGDAWCVAEGMSG